MPTGASGSSAVVTGLAALVVVAAVAAQFLGDRHTVAVRARFSTFRPVAQAALLALGLTIVGAFGPAGAAPFAYLPF